MSTEKRAQHTPTPWKIDQGSFQRTNRRISIIQDKLGISHSSPVVEVPIYTHDGTATATAAFIVRCANSHDALLEAAKAMFPNNIRHSKGCDIAKPCKCPVAPLMAAVFAAEGRT